MGRASDYFGPGTTMSALGETVFGTALSGTTAQVMGNPAPSEPRQCRGPDQ